MKVEKDNKVKSDLFSELKKKIDELKCDFSYTLEDKIAVSDFREANTTRYVSDGYTASQCDVSEERIILFALSRGLKSIQGENVTEENIAELLEKHCDNPLGISLLYYRMLSETVKKK